VRIDGQGSVNLETGERYQQVQKSEIEYGEVLGRGNGGMVRAGYHKLTNLPIAIKVSYLTKVTSPTDYQPLRQRQETAVLQRV
jgi:hypothetical protein